METQLNRAVSILERELDAITLERETRVKQFELEMKEFDIAVNDIRNAIGRLQNNPATHEVIHLAPVKSKEHKEGYPNDGTQKEQVLYLIHEAGRFLHNREIADLWMRYNHSIGTNREEVVEILSSRLSRFFRENSVAVIQVFNSNRNRFYGLPEWIDSEGRIKQGFEFNPDALIDKKSDNFEQYELIKKPLNN